MGARRTQPRSVGDTIPRLETLAILVGLLVAAAIMFVRMGLPSLGELDGAAAVFAMVAAWGGIALGVWSGANDDAVGG
jgi:hypothetical protein